MKKNLFGFVALALLATGCIAEHGVDQGADEGYDTGEEQVGTEQLEGQEPTAADTSDAAPSAGAAAHPSQRVLVGSRTIVCAGIQWPNVSHPAATTSACNNLSHELADYYRRNSRGLFTLVPVPGHTVDVPFNGSPANVYRAESIVTHTFNADFYVVPSIFTHPHSGASVSHVQSAQFMTAGHEVGHLLGLGHAGMYTYPAKGKPVLDHYGDHNSIMGRFFSNFLTPPQYYYLGWLPDEEVAMYDPGHGPYDVKQISDFSGAGLSTVIVPPANGDGRWAFVGALRCPENPKRTCITLHLSNDGGSQKVAQSNSEIVDDHFTGLHIQVLGTSGQTVSLAIDKP